MSQQEQNHVRQQLQSELRALSDPPSDIEAIAAARESEEMAELDRQANVALALARIDGRWRKRKEIASALERLRNGDYGLCQDCCEEIGEKRLKELPWATLCRSCQEERELEPAV